MMSYWMLIFFLLFHLFNIILSQDTFELRIHQNGEKGERMTMESSLRRKLHGLKSCFGQLESDIDWIEYRSSRGTFHLTSSLKDINIEESHNLTATLHLMCSGNSLHSLFLRIHVTHPNRHPPIFSAQNYYFYVPITLSPGSIVGKLEVVDNDAVIYNSQRQLEFSSRSSQFSIDSNGVIHLLQSLHTMNPFVPIAINVLAFDFGSPQLFSSSNISIIPVTVTPPRDIRVNLATKDYQVFEWEKPSYGHAERFRIIIRKSDLVVYEEEIEGRNTMSLTKVSISAVGNYSFRIISVDSTGDTPSQWHYFDVLHNDIDCDGECSSGGRPLCYYSSFRNIKQYTDINGQHCTCYPGYVGNNCQHIDQCLPEKTIDIYGGIEWNTSPANQTITIPCPYNTPLEEESIQRTCVWDRNIGKAVWNRQKETNKCKTQTSLLTHLGMLSTFAVNANHVSTVHTVARFMNDLFSTPSFSSNQSIVHFDQKIAEYASQVLDVLLHIDINSLEGNTSLAKSEMRNILTIFASRLPIPFSLSSPDLSIQLRSIQWPKRADPFDTTIGTKCRIKLPVISSDHVLRSVCLSNATFYNMIDLRNPVMSLRLDSTVDVSFSKMIIMLKRIDNHQNYTCVRYDIQEDNWSTKGMKLIDSNYHGFVKCETNQLGDFSILPDWMFNDDKSNVQQLLYIIPTVTTFITLIASIFLIFLAAVQKNQSVDLAFLIFLFFVFMIHVIHLVIIIAPQIGEPLSTSPSLHLIMQYSLLSISSSIYLVLNSLHSSLSSLFSSKSSEERRSCTSRPIPLFAIAIILPACFTLLTYYLSEPDQHDLSRLFGRIDWIFLCFYLTPCVFFISLSIFLALWNIYSAGHLRWKSSRSSHRFLPICAAIQASAVSIFLIFFLCCLITFFFLRNIRLFFVLLYSCSQLIYSGCSFLFSGYLFRMRFLIEKEEIGSDESLERKRDISRALLEHVDTNVSNNETSDQFIHYPNLYETSPMVSIV